MNATIFGAGNIGRGLTGIILSRSGYELTFIDADQELVDGLAAAGAYTVRAGDEETLVLVAGALHVADTQAVESAIAGSDLIATAVGAAILPLVATPIATGLASRRGQTVNVIACENVHPNSSALKALVEAEPDGPAAVDGVGFPDVVVDRIVPGATGSIDVTVEPNFEFVVDAGGWIGPTPETSDIVFSGNLAAFKLRKLWLVNGLHALAAWQGSVAGHDFIAAAVDDPAIHPHLESAAAAMVAVLSQRVDEFQIAELENYAAVVLRRFANAELGDPSVRVARQPVRKLEPHERVMDAANATSAAGGDISGFAAGIAAALMMQDERIDGLSELTTRIADKGRHDFLVDDCGVDPEGPLMAAIVEILQTSNETKERTMVTETITIENPSGLHARPAAEIVERVKSLDATIQIQKGEKVANANSIMSVLALGAATGDTVTVTAEGDGAEMAVAFVREIMLATEH